MSDKKIAAFYISCKPGPDRQPVRVDSETVVYVRAERLDVTDLNDSLDEAVCDEDESLMNTHVVAGDNKDEQTKHFADGPQPSTTRP